MKQKLLLLLFIFFSIIVQAQSPDANGVFYVKKNVTGGTGSGNSWANAIPELATAFIQARTLNTTTPGRVKQIWVAGGTYYPLYRADNWAGPTTTDRDNSFVLLNNVKVYGGFAGTETVLTARNLGIAANKSILSGNLNNTAIATDNAYHVIISSGEVGTAELNGFSIVEGNANGSFITVNSFSVNHYFGGGVYITNSRPELSNLEITNNIGEFCGGILFVHNIDFTNINISNSVISGNVATYASGIQVEYGALSLINCTVSGNRGGFSIRLFGGSVSLNNSVVSGNDTGVNLNYDGVLNRRNSLVQGFPADAVNFNLDGNLDPKFINAPNFATAPFATGDYNLQSDSPLINKGNNAYLQANQITDIAGKPRTINGIVDIGAYEFGIPLAITTSKTDVACYQGTDGSATATVVTGTAPYTYSWNTTPVQSTATATNLTAGTYTVTVTDAANNQATGTVTITEPAEIIVTVTGNETCEGSTATLTASGADDYNWYATASEVAPIATGVAFTTPALSATATYYVEGEKNGTVLSQPATLETVFTTPLLRQNGNMFNVTAASDIVISGFEINPEVTGNQTIEVYYKAGGYQGFEQTPGAWTLLGTTTITVATAGVPTSISVANLALPAGQTYGLYITMTGNRYLNYTEGSATYTDGTLTITSGTGNAYPFGFVFNPRIWNGRIHYKKAAVCTSPRIPVTITVNPPAVLGIVGTNVTCNGANNGEATVTATGAGPFSYSWNTVPVQNTATASGLAPGTYTVTVTDANGCEATESITITEPDVLVASINSFTNATCTGTPDGEATATVVGGTAPFSYSWNTIPVQNTVTATSLVDGNYMVTVTDANGCETTASITINVEDTVSPTVITQDFTVQLDASGNATIAVSDIDNGSSDNCSIDAMTLDMTDFDCTNLGANTVTVTVTDNNGNTSTATAIVTVEDTINPTVITQDFTVLLDVSGNATISVSDIDNGSSDNCAIDSLVLDVVSFDCTNLGPNTVTLTATDSSGNTSTGTAIVTVVDAINPIVVTQDITVYLDTSGAATITASEIDNGSSDNCAITTLALDVVTFDCTNLGPNTVTLTATDSSGNTASGTATVTVVNNLAPTIVTQDITVALNSTGTASIVSSDIVVNSGSNCGVQSIVLDVTDFDCTNLGPNTVTVTVTDNNGNTSTATAIVTVEDIINPTVITQDFTVQLDASGNATIAVSDIDNGSSDNCAIDSLVLDVVSFDCTNLGPNTVTVTATDFSGNISTGTAIVTVVDAINPIVVTQDITVYLDASGTATITASEIDNGSSDNCAIATLALDVVTFDCTNLGPNMVTLTATDSSGNTASGTATVTVVNNLAPTIVTQDITVPLNSTGTASIVSNDIVVSAGSNCGVPSIVLDVTDFDCTNIGPNTVTVTVTDNNGNTSTATAIVTVEDTINPTVITQDFTVQLDASGNATIAVSDIDNGSSDNCAIDTLVLDVVAFDCTNLGPNTVTLTATDSSGNTSTGTAIVTVVDAINPTVVTQDITVYLDASGTATIIASDIDNGSSDNCAITTLALDVLSFDCTNLGPNMVTLTATDSSGNISTGTATVTVVNNLAPTIVTQDTTVSLNSSGTVNIIATDIVVNSGSNCGVQSIVLDITDFDCTNLGSNTVTVTVTDNNGNTSTATAIVTVEDVINPTVITQDFTVQLDALGNATIAVSDIDNGSSDNCAIDSLVLDVVSFDCTNLGTNTVTLTATDFSGNISTATAIVTVVDNLGPVITSQTATINLDADGVATLTVQDVVVNVIDNCGVASTVISETDFDCSEIGNNTIVITSTDINGNISQQSVSVTVQDIIPPVAITQNIQVSLSQNGTFTLTPTMINNNSTDNCSIASMSLNITNFNCSHIGDNTVIFTVTDTFGNTNTATAIVTVLPIPEPTVSNLTQEFCAIDEPIVADIAIDDTLVQWFANATGGNPLSNTATLSSGMYYVATKYGNCYSARVAVNIIVKDLPAPTGEALQYICREQEFTIASLLTNEEEILWYDSPSGGTPLSSSTVLEHQQKYYASQIIGDCESANRLEVEVEIRYCDVVVYNSVSANGDGKNDYFKIEGMSYFPDNSVEIFNQWGQIVYKTSQYGEASGNYFKGIANTGIGISGNGQTLLPFGTYYYVIQFLNHDKQRMQKTGYLHLNH